MDGGNPLPDENAKACEYRDESACARLQHETRHQYLRCWRTDAEDADSLIRAVNTILAIPKRLSAAKYFRTQLASDTRTESVLSVGPIEKCAMICGIAS